MTGIKDKDIQGHSDRNIYLNSLKSCTEIKIVGFERNYNGSIGVKQPITIRRTSPYVTRQGIFNIFDSIRGISYLYEISTL